MRVLLLLSSVLALGKSEDISGCMDPTAPNFNPDATSDDGSCTGWPQDKIFCNLICTEENGEFTFQRPALNNCICGLTGCSIDCNSVEDIGLGCEDTVALNYNPGAIVDDGSCVYEDEIIEVTFKVVGVPDSTEPVIMKLKAGPAGVYEEHTMNDEDNDGTYTKTLGLYNALAQYKFSNGADETVPDECAYYSDRYVLVQNENIVLEAVLFDGCGSGTYDCEAERTQWEIDCVCMDNDCVSRRDIWIANCPGQCTV